MTSGQIIPPEPDTAVTNHWLRAALAFVVIFLLTACSPPQVRQGQIHVTVEADGKSLKVELPAGSTAQQAVNQSGLTLTALDRVDPPVYTVLSEGSTIRITRVREEFEVEQVVIPFERQLVQNESLPEGDTRLSQPGANGMQEITYRRVFENDVEVSKSVVRSTIMEEPVAEIVMVGSQAPFAAVAIPGTLAYLSSGNAWVMEGTTGNRRPLVTTGDLDGRVFSLSPNGKWLLFTRNNGGKDTINTLWVARVERDAEQILDLKIANVIQFAQFNAESNRIAFSTVEPRSAAPGWQANNELSLLALSSSGFVAKPVSILEANAGGVYGWWGMNFMWAPTGRQLAYLRPDSVGWIDLEEKILQPLAEVLPLQTRQDWAWVPGAAWSPDASIFYMVAHIAPPGSAAPEESPQFDLVGIPTEGGAPVTLASSVGMFAYPVASPVLTNTLGAPGEVPFRLAYLQAVFPLQSETSRYRLMVMDRDGSNKVALFPEGGAQGLEPQAVVWSPAAMAEDGSHAIAFIYQNNIWLVDLFAGTAVQITGDGLTNRLDWR